MNTSNSLVVTLLLMSFLTEVLPSNPDSEMVQDSSSNSKNQENSAPVTHDKQPRSALDESKILPDIVLFGVVKETEPVTTTMVLEIPSYLINSNSPKNNNNGFVILNGDKDITSSNANRIREQSPQRTEDETQESPQAKPNDPLPQDPTQRSPTDTSLSQSPQMTPNELFARNSPQGAITSEPPNDVFPLSTDFHLSRESTQREPSAPSSGQFPQILQNVPHRPLNFDDISSEIVYSISDSANNGPYTPNTMNGPITAPLLSRRPNLAPVFFDNRDYRPQFGNRPYVYVKNSHNIGPSSAELPPQSYKPINMNSNTNFNLGHNGPSSIPCTEQNPRCGLHDSSRNIGGSRVVTKTPTTERIPQIVSINPATNHNRRVSPDSNLYAEMINDFAFKLMRTLNTDGNFVISPMSIFIALSVCYLGSKGSTESQLEDALGLNVNNVHEERLHQGLKDLQLLITPQSSTNQLFLANGVFLGMNYTVNSKFAADIRNYYTAELMNLDFMNPMVSIPAINNWVSRSTRGMITSMADITPDSSTRLLLLNAMYFKGIWRTQFSESLTYNGRFFNLEGLERTVSTMVLYNETFPFLRSEEYKHSFLKLPYQGDDISMILALPHSFEEKPMPNITEQVLCHIRDDMKNTRLDTVTIPKFRQTHFRSLQRPLRQLGIRDLFNPRMVDLGKIRANKDLVVSAIMHKAVIDINEAGTTASAVTGVRLVPLAYRNTTNFLVNHPFAFYIVHEPTGLVLFYGKILDVEGRQGANSNRKQGNDRRG